MPAERIRQPATHWQCCQCNNIWLWTLYVTCTSCGHRKDSLCRPVVRGRPLSELPQTAQRDLAAVTTTQSTSSEKRRAKRKEPQGKSVLTKAPQSSQRGLPPSTAYAGILRPSAPPRRLSFRWPHSHVPEPAEERFPPTPNQTQAGIDDLLYGPSPIQPEDISIAEPDKFRPSLFEQTNTGNDDAPNIGSDNDESARDAAKIHNDNEGSASQGELEGADDCSQDRREPTLWSNFRDSPVFHLPFHWGMQNHVSQLALNPSSNDALWGRLAAWKFPLTAILWTSPVPWWPLRAQVQECTEGETMVAWDCSCGASLRMRLSRASAEAFCQRTGIVAQSPRQDSLLPTHQSQGSQVATTALGNGQTGKSGPGPRRSLAFPRRNSSGGWVSSAVVAPGTTQAQTSQKYLHWCVTISHSETKLVEFDVYDITDSNLVPSLLQKYSALRGLRSWLTLTSCAGFSKLFKDDDHVAYLGDEIPCHKTNTDYEYQYFDPQMPEKDFICVVQSIIALRIRKPRCPEIVKLGSALELIPKKINGRMQRSDGYGMYAVSAYCIWKAMVVLFVVSLPSVGFMVRWLVGHEGDWQNALTWLMVRFTMFNIVVLQHDRWSVEKVG